MNKTYGSATLGLPTIAAAIYCLATGAAVFLLMPVYLGAFTASYGMTSSQLGVLAAADLMGIAVASLSAVFWVKNAPWRLLSAASFTALIVCNWISIEISDFYPLLLLRFVTGIAAGCVSAVAMSLFSFSRSPDRVAALAILFQVTYQVVSFAILPALVETAGLTGFFQYVIAFQLVALVATVLIPGKALEHQLEQQQAEETVGRTSIPSLIILCAMVAFFITQTGIWAFIEVILNDAGYDDRRVSSALVISTLICLLGPLWVSLVGERFGRFTPILVAGIAQFVVLALLSLSVPFWGVILLLSVFQIFWTLPVGYHYGALVEVDRSHRFIALVPAAQSFGIGLGPLLGGFALESGGPGSLFLICSMSLMVYLLMILPVIRDRREAIYKTIGCC